jgi:PAS domain S-box-containing protein
MERQLTEAGPAGSALSEPASARAHTIWAPNESDELLRLAVQVGGIGIYDTDFEQNRARFSPELCVILGLPPGTEMTQTEASRLFDERDRAAVSASLEAARSSADEGKWSGVHRILRADGTVRWVSIHGRRHYRDTTNGRQTVRSIGTVVDITHLKETEAALHQSRWASCASMMASLPAVSASNVPICAASSASRSRSSL